MERLPIWLSAVGERTAGPGTADMNRLPLNGMRRLRLPMALIERPVQGHSNEEGTAAPQHHPDVSLRGAKRRGALSAKREEVPLGCNLAVPSRITGYSRRNRNCLPEIATSLRSSQ